MAFVEKDHGFIINFSNIIINVVSCKPPALCTQGCRGTLTGSFCLSGVNSVNNRQSSVFHGPAALLVFRTVIGTSAGPLNC